MTSIEGHAPTHTVGFDPLVDYRTVAAAAVADAYRQRAAPAFGYERRGLHQRVYLFPSEADARKWFAGQSSGGSWQLGLLADYTAYFVVPNLGLPAGEVLGTYDRGDPMQHADQVGYWFLPLALGVPAGALAGYYYRGWRDQHPGEWMPHLAISGDGTPWGSLVGTDSGAGQAPADWPRWQALIDSAIRDVLDADRGPSGGAAAYVWVLEPSSAVVIVPFASVDEALVYVRGRSPTDHVAHAVFDRHARHHWPNPVSWTRSHDPALEGVVAQHLDRATDHAVGSTPWQSIVGGSPWQSIVGSSPWQSIVGDVPWYTIVGAATEGLRRAAVVLAREVPGHLVIVVRDAQGNWRYGGFSTNESAIERFSSETARPGTFSYAALFDKSDAHFPDPFDEVVGEASPGPLGQSPTIQPITDRPQHVAFRPSY